jgi:DNA-binding NtrC family response regulator
MNPSPPTVLLIDDDPDFRSMLRRTLVRGGYAVQEAENGREGLKVLELSSVDVVVTDIIMPDMEGIELILQLRRTRPELRVIAMSAGGRINPESYLNLAKRSGAVRTLAKPFNLADFLNVVRETLAVPAAAAA